MLRGRPPMCPSLCRCAPEPAARCALRRWAELERPYRTPGGVLTSSVALVLACAALVATFLVDVTAALIALLVYAVAVAYFGLYSRKHLVAKAPEEEFAALAAAEAELARD